MEITQELLHELFEYRDGELYWKVANSNRVKVGEMAGYVRPDGYRVVRLFGKDYRIHRLIYIFHKGKLNSIIDHINNNRFDNRIENLRECTRYENGQNSKLYSNNKSGYKNVFWVKREEKWKVEVRIEGKKKSFGLYDDIELAIIVAEEARNKYHGAFANHGKTNEKVSS